MSLNVSLISGLWIQARIELALGQPATANQALQQRGPGSLRTPMIEREEAPLARLEAQIAIGTCA